MILSLHTGQIYVVAVLAASFFLSASALLAVVIILPIVHLLWLLSDESAQKSARYLPSMIIGRGNAMQESQRRTAALRLFNQSFLLWLLVGNLLIVPPFIAALFYESAALGDVTVFLRAHFDVSPAWQGVMIETALHHAALIWIVGAGVWSAYFYGAQSNDKHDVFAYILFAVFGASVWRVWPEAAPYVSEPTISAYMLILVGLLCWPVGAIAVDFVKRQSGVAALSLLCAVVMAFAFYTDLGTLPLYLSGWMALAFAWGKSLSHAR